YGDAGVLRGAMGRTGHPARPGAVADAAGGRCGTLRWRLAGTASDGRRDGVDPGHQQQHDHARAALPACARAGRLRPARTGVGAPALPHAGGCHHHAGRAVTGARADGIVRATGVAFGGRAAVYLHRHRGVRAGAAAPPWRCTWRDAAARWAADPGAGVAAVARAAGQCEAGEPGCRRGRAGHRRGGLPVPPPAGGGHPDPRTAAVLRIPVLALLRSLGRLASAKPETLVAGAIALATGAVVFLFRRKPVAATTIPGQPLS